jgi:signal peptide peptidase-like protein 2B
MARGALEPLVVLLALAAVATGGDIRLQDDDAPKIPGCSNDFVLVRAASCLSVSPRARRS